MMDVGDGDWSSEYVSRRGSRCFSRKWGRHPLGQPPQGSLKCRCVANDGANIGRVGKSFQQNGHTANASLEMVGHIRARSTSVGQAASVKIEASNFR